MEPFSIHALTCSVTICSGTPVSVRQATGKRPTRNPETGEETIQVLQYCCIRVSYVLNYVRNNPARTACRAGAGKPATQKTLTYLPSIFRCPPLLSRSLRACTARMPTAPRRNSGSKEYDSYKTIGNALGGGDGRGCSPCSGNLGEISSVYPPAGCTPEHPQTGQPLSRRSHLPKAPAWEIDEATHTPAVLSIFFAPAPSNGI